MEVFVGNAQLRFKHALCTTARAPDLLNGCVPRIEVYPFYYHNHLPGSENDCFLRNGTVEKLINAAEQAPSGLKLVVLDGWRSYET